MNLRFVKGHMGGNTVLLLQGVEKDDSWLVNTALQLLEKRYLCCHQAGFLYSSEKENSLRARIVGFSTRGFISACGGLTQVLGAAVKGGFLEHLGIPFPKGKGQILLETEGGEVNIHISGKGGDQKEILTDMSSFVKECYDIGIERVSLKGIEALRIGKFLVVNAEELRRKEASGNFELFDPDAFSTLKTLQSTFQKECNTCSCDYAIYDWSKSRKGWVRAVFPHGIERGHVEPACGTGSVAVGLAAIISGELDGEKSSTAGEIELYLETGGGFGLVGDETTRLVLGTKNRKVESAFFSHSKVEILASGTVFI